jgi:hypothetical protein
MVMAQPNGTTTTLTATVEAVNERGIKINGGWLNVSKFHAVALPMRGALVALEVQGGRWIQRCDVLDATAAEMPPGGARMAATAPGARDAMISPPGRAEERRGLLQRPRGGEGGRHPPAGGELRGVADTAV